MNNLKTAQKELLKYGTKVYLIAADTSNREQIRQAVKEVIALRWSYVASKFALVGFIDVLRQEVRGTGVMVSTIFPGRVDTG
jgi:hypothetical protein